MAQFTAKPQGIYDGSNHIKQTSRQVRACSDEIRRVSAALAMSGSASLCQIRRDLNCLGSTVLDEAARMDSLAAALNHIAQSYTNTERKLCGEPGLDSSGFARTLKELIARIKELLGFILGPSASGEAPATEEETARAQEKKHDLYLQSEIFNLMSTKAYNKETWQKASVEQRKVILTNFLAEINGIMGLNVNKTVNFQSLGSSTRGQYSSGSNSVTINVDYLSRADSYQIMQTMVHEMRHAYQRAAISEPEKFNVSPETISQWRANFSDYKTTSKDGWDAYIRQPIEWDAKNFAKQFSDVEGYTPVYAGSW